MSKKKLTYAATGVDIDATDAVKRRMVDSIDSGDPRVLNKLGAFAPLVQGSFPGIEDPLLVIKTDEPGSKQKLAIELERFEGLSRDLVNHTVNDVIVMGAQPMYVTDCIVCGRLDEDIVGQLVQGMAAACKDQECVLIGGETSVQPGVVVDGLFVLSATVIGVVDRQAAIDGSAISPGDVLLALSSNGLHTNGYTLVRELMERDSALRARDIDGEAFLDVIMRPHTGYYPVLKSHFGEPGLHGMAHITGGGILDNLKRILPANVDAVVDLSQVAIPPVFAAIREEGSIDDADMLRTFNLGVGLVCVCAADFAAELSNQLTEVGTRTRFVGEVQDGSGQARTMDSLSW
ncbi:MAG: phosphoribosylformylglycinamidine cyclo-ligase [Candidatus Latescibacterota bacterium]|nr:phosphoribosylformylglycinamidine cyclo-ligase [Candidatus Latescibacterota bacterium]